MYFIRREFSLRLFILNLIFLCKHGIIIIRYLFFYCPPVQRITEGQNFINIRRVPTMLKTALILAAAKKSKNPSVRHAASDAADGLAIIFLIVIGMVAAVIFIGCPVIGIIGGAKLISGETEAAYAMMAEGAFGGFLNMLIALCLGASTIEECFFPYPRYYRYETEEIVAQKRKNRKGCLWLTLGGLAVAGIIAGLVALVVVNVAANPVFAGVMFIVLFSLSMVFIIAGALVKLIFG